MTQMIESCTTLILCRATSQERTYNVYSRGDPCGHPGLTVAPISRSPCPGTHRTQKIMERFAR